MLLWFHMTIIRIFRLRPKTELEFIFSVYVEADEYCNDLVFQLGAAGNGVGAVAARMFSIKVSKLSIHKHREVCKGSCRVAIWPGFFWKWLVQEKNMSRLNQVRFQIWPIWNANFSTFLSGIVKKFIYLRNESYQGGSPLNPMFMYIYQIQ